MAIASILNANSELNLIFMIKCTSYLPGDAEAFTSTPNSASAKVGSANKCGTREMRYSDTD